MATCAACAKRAERRRMIFDVGESPTSAREMEKPQEGGRGGELSPPEETRMVDLLNLAKRTRERLATHQGNETLEVPISVREAILLVDSIAPASIEPARVEVEPYPLEAPPSPSPARRRMRAVYSGAGLFIVMAGLLVAKARVGQEVASAAGREPDANDSAGVLMTAPRAPETAPSPAVAVVAPKSASTSKATPTAPTAPPRPAPIRPAPARPSPPAAERAPEMRAAAEPTAPAHTDLLGAMAAAVAAHSAPSIAPRVDSTPAAREGSETPSPSARGETRTSPLRP